MIFITVLEKDSSAPVEGATVNMISPDMNATHITTIQGMVEDFNMEPGVFTVTTSHPGYISKQEDITVDCVSMTCDNCENTFTINLEKISNANITDPVDPANNNTVIPQVCEGATGSITVLDYLTRQPLDEAIVNVRLLSNSDDRTSHEIATNIFSNPSGQVSIPMTVNGVYQISVEKEDYLDMTIESEVSCHLDDCDACNLDVTVALEPNTTTSCED